MGKLIERDEFTEEVYQLEVTDFVEGGENGVDNKPHNALANRTRWLKSRIDAFIAGTGLTKAMVGLANVDNTADLAKPINTATQNVLDSFVEQIAELETWKNDSISRNGGVNLYKNSRFVNIENNHPVGFYHYYSHGNPVYFIVPPDFNAIGGDGKIAADLVRLVGADSWYNTPFNCLKVVCNGTKDTTTKYWTLNQNVFKGRGPLTRGCYVLVRPSSITNTAVEFQIGDNPAGAYSEVHTEVDTPLKIMGQGLTDGNYLGFNLNVYINMVNSNETVTFYIVAPFFVEGFVDGYRISISDFNN